jgi:hypothetical protein
MAVKKYNVSNTQEVLDELLLSLKLFGSYEHALQFDEDPDAAGNPPPYIADTLKLILGFPVKITTKLDGMGESPIFLVRYERIHDDSCTLN